MGSNLCVADIIISVIVDNDASVHVHSMGVDSKFVLVSSSLWNNGLASMVVVEHLTSSQ
jgi:hypothetical protein